MRKYKIFHAPYPMYLHKMEIRTNSIIMSFDNGVILVANNFRIQNGNLKLLVYNPSVKKWIRTIQRNEYTEAMIVCHNEHDQTTQIKGIKQLMKHERQKKSESGGQRLSKWNGNVTDYECAKVPLHDFPRSFCVNWN